MSFPIMHVFEQSNDDAFDLVDSVFNKLADKVSQNGEQSLSEEERVVFHIWNALGIIENGSFQYFIENDLNAAAVAACFDELGIPLGAAIFREADRLLARSALSEEWSEQLKMLQKEESVLDAFAQQILQMNNEIEERLSKYIGSHADLRRLLDRSNHRDL
jgi:hypothetical protein